MISFSFTGWSAFSAKKQPRVLRNWLKTVGVHAQRVFTAGLHGPHSGIVYYRRGGTHQASSPGEYPANDTGGLVASFRKEATENEVTIGTTKYYAKWLREGSKKMARRKMSDNALQEGGATARPASRGWVKWAKGR